MLFVENVVCRTSSKKRHFETEHEKSFKDKAEKTESLKKAVFCYKKQSSIFKNVIQTIKGSYKVIEGIAKYRKPFTNGVFVKEAFLSCAEVLFDNLPNKCTIILRIKGMPVFPWIVEEI